MQFLKRETHFDFIGKQNLFILISLAFIAASIAVFAVQGLKFGIDFAGGTELYLQFKDPITSAEIRKLLTQKGFKDTMVQHFGEEAAHEYLIRLERSTGSLKLVTEDIENVFVQARGKDAFTVRKIEMVGPKVGGDLKKRGAWAFFYSLLGILIYVAIRFDYRFSPGGVIALIHDVIITLGLFAFFGKKFDLNTLAAILTLVGYSINDTIVIFDRIRENLKKYEGMDVAQLINKSVNETLSRTILTSLTVFIVVAVLFILGGEVIHDFAFVLMVGVVVGSYSTIFIASPIFLYLHNKRFEKS